LILEAISVADRGLPFCKPEPKEGLEVEPEPKDETGLEVDPDTWEPWSRLNFHKTPVLIVFKFSNFFKKKILPH
jgi:hypothetical protein